MLSNIHNVSEELFNLFTELHYKFIIGESKIEMFVVWEKSTTIFSLFTLTNVLIIIFMRNPHKLSVILLLLNKIWTSLY